METEANTDRAADAIAWHIRLRDGDGDAWEEFADWLAEDPRHPAAYDAVESADIALECLLPQVSFRTAANDAEIVDDVIHPPTKRPRRFLLGGLALAASLAAAIVIAPQSLSRRYDVATGPGERRTVALDATTHVSLNGSTRMTFDHNDARFASLVAGEALFIVRHDAARPFTLEVGDNVVRDVGTIFNVVHDAGEVRVAVSEGGITYNPGGDNISLQAGQSLVDTPSSTTVRVMAAPIAAIGGWQKGQLLFGGEPLSQVAAGLTRALGVRVSVSPAIAGRPFSGAIRLDGSGPSQLDRLAPALDVEMEQGGAGWIMKPTEGDVRQ